MVINEQNILLKIMQLRKDRGWSQQELAQRMGVKQAVVSRIENGSGHLMLQTILRFAKVFEVDPALLLGVTRNAVDPEWERFQALSFERKQQAQQYIDNLFRLEELERAQAQVSPMSDESEEQEPR